MDTQYDDMALLVRDMLADEASAFLEVTSPLDFLPPEDGLQLMGAARAATSAQQQLRSARNALKLEQTVDDTGLKHMASGIASILGGGR